MRKNIFRNVARPFSKLLDHDAELAEKLTINSANQTSYNSNQQGCRTFKARLVIARHGETDLNVDKVWAGQSDARITQNGLQQAQMMGKILRSHNFIPDIVLTTPLTRAYKTAQEALLEMGCSHIVAERIVALVELSPGDYTKKKKNELNKNFTKTWDKKPPEMDLTHQSHPENILQSLNEVFLPMPFGESLQDVATRTKTVYDYILSFLQQDKNVFVVAHSNSLSALISHFSGEKSKLKIANCIPFEISFEKKGSEIEYLGIEALTSNLDKTPNFPDNSPSKNQVLPLSISGQIRKI